MNAPRLALLAFLGGFTGCAGVPAPPPPNLARVLTILPVNNRTDDPLLVAGSGLIDRYVHSREQVTVADVLQSEARLRLQENGFEVPLPEAVEKALKGRRGPTDPDSAATLALEGGLGPLAIYLEIRRWEPDSRVQIRNVVVDLSACLIDVPTRRVIWRAEHRSAPVATQGAFLRGDALVTAARKVVADLLSPLRPGSP